MKKSENEEVARAGRSNEKQLLELLKSMRNEPTFNDEDYVLLRQLIRAFEDGIIPRKTSKKILNDVKKEEKPSAVRILSIFRGYISEKYLEESIDYELTLGAKREVVLSEYFY